MTIELLDQTADQIHRHVALGRFATIDDVVGAGLPLLEEREDARGVVRAKIAEGLAQSDRGEGLDGHEVFKALLAGLKDDEFP